MACLGEDVKKPGFGLMHLLKKGDTIRDELAKAASAFA